jgi:hypothetical protein
LGSDCQSSYCYNNKCAAHINECTDGTYRCNGTSTQDRCYDSDNDYATEWIGWASCPYNCSNNACNPPPKKGNGESCSAASECYSNICLHNVCRPSSPYCTDSYCDSSLGETYSSCPADCKKPFFNITGTTSDKSIAQSGDVVTFNVSFKNAGSAGTVYIGGAVKKPDGTFCNTESKSATISSGSTGSVLISWTVPSSYVSGNYGFFTSSWDSCISGCANTPCYNDGCCSGRQDNKENNLLFTIKKQIGESCSAASECQSGKCGDISKKCVICTNECLFSGCSSDGTYSCDGLADPDSDGCSDKVPCSNGCSSGACLRKPDGKSCSNGLECQSYLCLSGRCGGSACADRSDCPANGFIGSNHCLNTNGNSLYGDVYKTYRTYIGCIFPGTLYASCSYSDSEQLQQECGSSQICQDAQCKTNNIPFNTSLEDADHNVRVYKQPGDLVSIIVRTASDQEISLSYPSEFTIISGDYSNGKIAVKAGKENIITFQIPENVVAKSNYTFRIGDSTEKVEVIKDPRLLIITDRKALIQRYSQSLKVYDVLKEAYKQADSQRGVIYSLDVYIYEKPWKSFENYKNINNLLSLRENITEYVYHAALLVKEKCNGCKNIIILGDDSIVPYLRKDVLYRDGSSKQVYTDIQYTPITSPSFGDLDFKEFFWEDSVKIVIPDSISKDSDGIKNLTKAIYSVYHYRHVPKNGGYCLNDPYGYLGITCTYTPLPANDPCPYDGGCDFGNEKINNLEDIKIYYSSEVGCDSFGKLDHSTIIILGNSKINRATACYPWVEDSEYPILSLDRNIWDGTKGAIILNADIDSLPLGTDIFSSIIADGTWRSYFSKSSEAIFVELAVGIVPLSSCKDVFDFGDNVLDIQEFSFGNIIWCGLDAIPMITAPVKLAKAGKGVAIATKAASELSDAAEVAKETGRLQEAAKAAGKSEDFANVLAKDNKALSYLAIKAGESGGKKVFRGFVVDNLDEISKMSSQDFKYYAKGTEKFLSLRGQKISNIPAHLNQIEVLTDIGKAEQLTKVGTEVKTVKFVSTAEILKKCKGIAIGCWSPYDKMVYLAEESDITQLMAKGTIYHEYTHPLIIQELGDAGKISSNFDYVREYEDMLTEFRANTLFNQEKYADYIISDLDKVKAVDLAKKEFKSEIVKMKVLAEKFGSNTANTEIDNYVKTLDATTQSRFNDAFTFFKEHSNVETMSKADFINNVNQVESKIELLGG